METISSLLSTQIIYFSVQPPAEPPGRVLHHDGAAASAGGRGLGDPGHALPQLGLGPQLRPLLALGPAPRPGQPRPRLGGPGAGRHGAARSGGQGRGDGGGGEAGAAHAGLAAAQPRPVRRGEVARRRSGPGSSSLGPQTAGLLPPRT